MSEPVPAGDVVAAFLESAGMETAFGVISIHNMPMLDAIGRRNRIRFVPARGEAGAVNMADANARVSGGLGVAFTSTGTGAGNACGALVEAQTAGTPLLHLTGQIETKYLDQERGLHPRGARPVDHVARRVQGGVPGAERRRPAGHAARGAARRADPARRSGQRRDTGRYPGIVAGTGRRPSRRSRRRAPSRTGRSSTFWPMFWPRARRPMLWLGGGVRGASDEARSLARLGFGVVTSIHGRGAIPEGDPMSLGAYNFHPPVEAFYATCDAMLVVGSRLRGNETLKYRVALPRPLCRIDVDPRADGRSFANDIFVCGDAAKAMVGLAARLNGRMAIDPAFGADIATAREAAETALRETLGPYEQLMDDLQAAVPDDVVWVRDITLSNSTWGNRAPRLSGPRDGRPRGRRRDRAVAADGDRRRARRRRAQDRGPGGRRRARAFPRRNFHHGPGVRRCRPDRHERRRLWRHQEYSGPQVRRAGSCMPTSRFPT